MDVADQFLKIGVPIDNDGFVPVLEEMADPPVAPVKSDRVPGEPTAHEQREAQGTAATKEMDVVHENRPSVDQGSGRRGDIAKACQEVLSVCVVGDNGSPFEPAEHHVVQCPWAIEACLAGHVGPPEGAMPTIRSYLARIWSKINVGNNVPKTQAALVGTGSLFDTNGVFRH
jgi:hypothetical protein